MLHFNHYEITAIVIASILLVTILWATAVQDRVDLVRRRFGFRGRARCSACKYDFLCARVCTEIEKV